MIVKDISFSRPEDNILFDEVLLALAEKGETGEVLRFWESPVDFIVLGRISKESEDICWEHVSRDHVPVLRRASGGGTVLQGPGCLNFSLILSKVIHPELSDINQSYRWVLERIIGALGHLGIRAVFMPISDLALAHNQKKVSGNAQKRGKTFILHHGTVLCSADLKKIEHYLLMPKDKPQYRGSRSHLDFVANLNCTPIEVKKEITSFFMASPSAVEMSSLEKETLKAFVLSKNPHVAQL